ncbi:hypothetical protein CONLIGDRAFT_638422 [Coniochaeta ligniaria NRRL 30616]|uniref:Uncharacterized protein n=1 Tax=Coniochaeta ligniaria NRRL 30616 TaxID=1408157 RepID=A0A1J7I3Y3_9PEZI|nr:hypothetical protein CONLIGDRAFT_638422 [Coniochaeta ligniaria NRRL 30616]
MATDNMSTADAIARIIDLFRRRTFSKRGVVNIASLNDALRQASGDEALAYDGAGDGRDGPELVVQVKTRGLEEYPPPVPISTGTRVPSTNETRVLSMDEIRGAIAKSAASFQEIVSSTELCACVVNAFHELSDQDIWDIQLIGMGDNSTRRTMQLLQPQSAVQYIIGRIVPTTQDVDRFDRMLNGRMDNFGCILEQGCYKIRDGDGVLYAELICLLAVLAGKTEYVPQYVGLQRHVCRVRVMLEFADAADIHPPGICCHRHPRYAGPHRVCVASKR